MKDVWGFRNLCEASYLLNINLCRMNINSSMKAELVTLFHQNYRLLNAWHHVMQIYKMDAREENYRIGFCK